MANIFNAAQYLALYPAIADYGYNEANAWDHFVQYGAAELRTPNDELEGKVYAESVLNYANGNPELAEYFGVVVPAESLTAAQQGELLLHYVMYGNAEERENKIIDAPEQSEDADLSDLRDALETIVAADADVKEAVEAAVEGLERDDVAEDSLENQEKAVKAEYNKAADIIEDGGDAKAIPPTDNDALAIPGFAAVEDAAVRTQLIEAKQAQLAVVEQQTGKALDADKAKVDAYLAAEARVENLNARLKTAEKNAENAGTLAGAALTVANDGTFEVVYGEPQEDGTIGEANQFVITEKVSNEVVTLTINPETNQVSFGELINGQEALVKVIKASPNYSSLTQSLQQVNSLDNQLFAAEERRDEAKDEVPTQTVEVEDEDGNPIGEIEVFSNAAQAYINAKNNVKDFAENVADFREVEAYQNAIDEANAAKEAAVDALKELGYEINTDDFGTAGDDLFVYANDDATVFAFGAEGEDLFFFGDFAFVELKPNDDFNKGGFGDRNVLEIFAQQQGTDVVLYVEVNEVGGTATGFADVDTITLVGVNLEDLSFDSGAGFLVG